MFQGPAKSRWLELVGCTPRLSCWALELSCHLRWRVPKPTRDRWTALMTSVTTVVTGWRATKNGNAAHFARISARTATYAPTAPSSTGGDRSRPIWGKDEAPCFAAIWAAGRRCRGTLPTTAWTDDGQCFGLTWENDFRTTTRVACSVQTSANDAWCFDTISVEHFQCRRDFIKSAPVTRKYA